MDSPKPAPGAVQSAKESTRAKPPTSAKTVRTKANSKEQTGKEKDPREVKIPKNQTTQPPESLAEEPSPAVAPSEAEPSSSPTLAAPPAKQEKSRSQSAKAKVGRGAGPAGAVGREYPPFNKRSKEKERVGVEDERVDSVEKKEDELAEICISCGLPK